MRWRRGRHATTGWCPNPEDRALSGLEIAARAAETGADAVLCCAGDRLDAAAIAALPGRVRVLATFSVGTDHIDLEAARARGLIVTNTPDVLTDATADIALLLLLGAGTPRLGRGADDPRRCMDRLDADPADGNPCRGQAAGHRRHGAHRPGGRLPRAGLRHGDPLQQPPPLGAGTGAGRHLPSRPGGDAAGVRCPVASFSGHGGNPALAERRTDRSLAAGRHPDQHRARAAWSTTRR